MWEGLERRKERTKLYSYFIVSKYKKNLNRNHLNRVIALSRES